MNREELVRLLIALLALGIPLAWFAFDCGYDAGHGAPKLVACE